MVVVIDKHKIQGYNINTDSMLRHLTAVKLQEDKNGKDS